ncbi:LmeA family phospholipid-binding protein [Nonomuraea sp. LPB2021202275-12-8]|uniref:LmeA family phospholipid-binding protein n=1 Tax=Nonomuraea sp. LPB2021202275-12-8 TaxID=3120159 RepID=UPI00300CF632
MRKLAVFLMVLIVLLVVVDRVAVTGVQRDLANRIAASADLDGPPTVTIEGIPFLTQAVSGHYPEVRFDLGTLRYGGVPVKDLQGVAYDVTAPLADVIQNRADIRAGRLTVRGTLTRATIDGYAPKGVKITGNGQRLVASGELMVGVNKVKFNAEMRVQLVDGGILLQAEKIEGVPDQLARFVSYTIPFKGKLPFDVKVTGVRSVADGLEFSAEASDVPLRG